MRTSNILLVSLMLFAVTACTERIDINVGSTYTRLVVYGTITTDTMAHQICLSKSADYFSNKPVEKISGAKVTISDGTVVTLLHESATEPGVYETPSDFYGVPGRTYRLFVEQVDLGDGKFVSDSASSYLPKALPVDSIRVEQDDFYTEGWAVKLFAKDPEGEGNCYAFKTYINGKLDTDTLSNHTTTDDRFFDGNYTNGITVFFYEDLEKIKYGDNVTLETMMITRDYMDFITSVQTAVGGRDPLFSGPPANITTNFKNGALGFFAAYSLTRKSTIVKAPAVPKR